MNLERTVRRKIPILNLTPLIDVLFILIIFFMLTTSFMRIESMELILPSATGKTASKQEVVRVFIHPDGRMQLGQRRLSNDELEASLKRMFEHDAATRIMVLTAEGVTMQQMVDVMDRVYAMGGKSLFVRKWEGK